MGCGDNNLIEPNGYRYIQLKTNLKIEIQMITEEEHLKAIQLVKDYEKQMNISVVELSYNDVKKWCDENGYYKGIYWFPNR